MWHQRTFWCKIARAHTSVSVWRTRYPQYMPISVVVISLVLSTLSLTVRLLLAPANAGIDDAWWSASAYIYLTSFAVVLLGLLLNKRVSAFRPILAAGSIYEDNRCAPSDMVPIVGSDEQSVSDTERHSAHGDHENIEEALKTSRAHLAGIIGSAMDAVITIDEEQRILIFNSAAERMFSYSANDVIGHPLETLIPKRFRKAHAKHIKNFALTNITNRRMGSLGQLMGLRSTGEEFYIEASISQLVSGKQKLFTVILRDITERIHAEEALRASEARYRDLIEQAADGIILSDRDANLIEVNRRACEMLGYTREELLGLNLADLIPAADLAAQPLGHKTLATGETMLQERNLRRKDGAPIPVESTIKKLVDGTVQSIVRDITERKRSEELRKAKEVAEEANRAKSDFLSRMSHELRTPLNSILGFGQLLTLDNITPSQAENVSQILKGGWHLLDLINEVLDISRVETGRLSLSPEPVLASTLLNECLQLSRVIADERQIIMSSPAPGTTNVYVLADRQRLTQVILNLFANAIKYNRTGGSVSVSCTVNAAKTLRINVSDTGYGIPKEKMPRLFTPFDRLGAETSGVEGTGLGLALSKKLIEAMHGDIGAESVSNKGSTFWVELPIAESQLERLEREEMRIFPQDIAAMKTSIILYIEDNLANLKLVERLLARYPNLTLLSAMQGRLGIDLARQEKPDLILLDLHLPDIHGEEVLRMMKTDPLTDSIPVIIISADATKREMDLLRTEGAYAYLTKPFDVRKFIDLVEAVLKP